MRWVDNELDIAITPQHSFVHDSHLYPWYPIVGDWSGYHAPQDYSSEELERRILDELIWDPDVDSWQVEVRVEGSNAILEGQVDSYLEKIEATENALEGGAMTVENRLVLQ